MNHFIVFFIFLLTCFPGKIQERDNPGIVFNNTVYDFGTLNKGENADCIFYFTNSNQSPLVIVNVKASCGCTSPTWTKEPVAPGKTGQIKVKYNTNITGIFTKTVTVYTNLDKNPVLLTIRGEVKRRHRD